MDLPDVGPGVLFGAITMVAWGVWLVLGNAASESIDPRTAAAISYVVAATLAVVYVLVSDASLVVTPRGGLLAVVAGVFTAIGLVSTYIGLSVGTTTTVSTVGAMYFVVAALIGMAVLGDELTARKVAGLAFAALGVALIAR
ncbi:EamA family transporter [Halomarina salina]|uniref:EamA family transporter n=1 Tax=Halomarina salina TaxID=1872699 RepID=A0ABD5RSL9_9EURY|nr:EamA family transporter [Halomarina salina]